MFRRTKIQEKLVLKQHILVLYFAKKKQQRRKKKSPKLTMFDVKAFLMFVCLGLLCAILILILINAIRRTFFSSRGSRNHATGVPHNMRVKYVDLYSSSVATLPVKDALPGMTALVDLGVTNLETGIYMLQNANSWVKVSVPEVGDCYHIVRGESAGKQHTVMSSFVYEIRAPAETQIFDNEHLFQELLEATSIIYIQSDIRKACHLTVSSQNSRVKQNNAFPAGRLLKIINTSSKFAFTISGGDGALESWIAISPQTIKEVHLSVNVNDPLAPYALGAFSS